jgi:sulfide dehydrogenase cytochrome subunit
VEAAAKSAQQPNRRQPQLTRRPRSSNAAARPRPRPAAIAQPANTEGRLLASNCFQCHGTLGTGGFDSIRGGEASEVLEYMTKTANRDIMAAHAQGYTRAQLQSIIAYLQQ